ncbi:anti-sigma regulatory factor [Streptomyces sp. NPDC047097]|uniref:anti-sigma regulatory factor n=1 Tax=Streptomyces sp. NPDC047097 TaxID=3155260 RepID=UPI0033D233CB
MALPRERRPLGAPVVAPRRPPDDRPPEGRTTGIRPPSGRPSGAAGRYPAASEEDLLTLRHAVRAATVEAGFGLVDQTRIVTAISELARNAYVYGGGGTVRIEPVASGTRRGLRLTVSDEGPGIADLERCLTDGYTTGSGLGHGLGGARRLMHEFGVRSAPGQGTTVVVARWKDR